MTPTNPFRFLPAPRAFVRASSVLLAPRPDLAANPEFEVEALAHEITRLMPDLARLLARLGERRLNAELQDA